MFVEVRLEGEGFVALGAREMFEGGVCLHVRPQVRPVGERLPTVGAAERLLARV